MITTVESRRTYNYTLPKNPTQDDWYYSIQIALMKLKIIPSDLYDFDFGTVIVGIPLSERQCKCIDEFWDGLDHLEPSDSPIMNFVKKVLQLLPTNTPLDTKHRTYVEILFEGSSEHIHIPFGYQIALSLESPFFKTFFQSQQPYLIKDCDKNALTQFLKTVCSNKKVDLKQATTLLPLAIKFQLKKLEQKFINETNRALNDLFAKTNSDETTHLEEIFRFLRILETEYGWRPLPDEIIKNLRNHASQYKLNFDTYRYIQNCVMLLDNESPARRPQLRNFLSSCVYNYRKMWSDVSMWETLQRLNPSELTVKGPSVFEFEDILKISALKKLVIFEYKQLNFHTESSDSDDDEGISANASITEFSVTIDTLSSLPLNLPTLVNLLPNVQMFELSNSRYQKDHSLLLLNTGDYVNSFIEWNKLQTIKFYHMRVNCYSLLNVNMSNHLNLKEIVFTNCTAIDTPFDILARNLSPKIKVTIQ